MVKVRALTKGYVGNVIREIGDVFEWPKTDKVGSWVEPVEFGGKGDHDGDGLNGGSVPAADEPKPGKAGKGGKKGKAETVNAPTAEPFADAPAPETVSGSTAQAAIGGIQPDWLPPGSGHSDEPVMADD